MDKLCKRTRDISFFSKKNGTLILVHSEEARSYTKYLEECSEITSYETCKPLDPNRVRNLQKTDIRGQYFQQEWASDFYINFADETAAVREIVKPDTLKKRSDVEKLELSRRYWAGLGISDWKVVIVGGK